MTEYEQPLAKYTITRTFPGDPIEVLDYFSNPEIALVEIGTATACWSEELPSSSKDGDDPYVKRLKVWVQETLWRFLPLTVEAICEIKKTPDEVNKVVGSVIFHSNSAGTEVFHTYKFTRGASSGECTVEDVCEIRSAPPCMGGLVIRTAKQAHTKTMDALQEKMTTSIRD